MITFFSVSLHLFDTQRNCALVHSVSSVTHDHSDTPLACFLTSYTVLDDSTDSLGTEAGDVAAAVGLGVAFPAKKHT